MQSNAATQSRSGAKAARPTRRYDIDWLRVLAVLLLFPFHTARIFDTFAPWYVKNSALSEAMTYFTFIVHPWHMPLLFLLAGASTFFALGFRSGGQYAKERFTRLLIPLIFGLLVIVPPQSYFGLRSHSSYSGSYLAWYSNFFRINPGDLDGYRLGGFTPGHLWFILYLFVFSLMALPLFLWLKRDSGKRLVSWVGSFSSLPGMIFLPAILLYGTRRLDITPNPLYFITFFVFGYFLVADARIEKTIDRHKAIALVLGPLLYLPVAYFRVYQGPNSLPPWFWTLWDPYFWGIVPWFSLIAILGFGRRFLRSSNPFLKYTGEASYPLYIIHQTVIVIIGFYVVQWSAGIATKYLTILIAAVVVSTIIYDLLIKRLNVTRFLFGMRLKRKPGEVSAPRSKEVTV